MKVSATVGTFMALYHTCEAPQALRSQEKIEAAINGETPLDTPLLGEVQRNRVYKIVKKLTHYIHLTLPAINGTGVLPSSIELASCPDGLSSRGSVSRSVLRGKPVCFRVPHGTASIR
jgi:hypothetical protein